MGTRHLIAAYIDGAPRIAQYGQWDGYPSGQGISVLRFLRDTDLEAFKTALRNCHWLTDAEAEAAYRSRDWEKSHPQLSRDTGSDVLQMVLDAGGLGLINKEAFAADSLFCEWAYAIDLDADVFEVYEGFQKQGQPITGRYAQMPIEGDPEYAQVSLRQSWPLNALPTEEEFLAALHEEEEDESA